MMQVMIHVEMLVKDSVCGDFAVTVMKIFIITKNMVINRAIRPGTTSCGITKLIFKKNLIWINFKTKIANFHNSLLTHEIVTSKPDGM